MHNDNAPMWRMMLLHLLPMGVLLFWNKIPAGYTWLGYGAIGFFIVAHFIPAFGGGCGDHAHTNADDGTQSNDHKKHAA